MTQKPSLSSLTNQIFPQNDESKTDEIKNVVNQISSLNVKSGIDDRMQGDIIVTHEGTHFDPYQSLSIKDFPSMKLLRDELLDGCSAKNFIHPSKIQATGIPICLKPKLLSNGLKYFPNLIAQAHHGSGKTATFTLIMLQRIDESESKLQGLCVVHSRELANQTYSVIKSLSEFIDGLKITLALPGKQLPNPWDSQICIGTPGTLISKVINPSIRKPINKFLEHFKALVIDEADEFLKSNSSNKRGSAKGRGSFHNKSNYGSLYDQLKRIEINITNNTKKLYVETEKLKKGDDCEIYSKSHKEWFDGLVTDIMHDSEGEWLLIGYKDRTQQIQRKSEYIRPKKRNSFQTLLFSATYPQKVKKLAADIAPSAYIIRLEKKQVQLDNIITYKIECNDDSDKFNTLLKVISLGNIGQMIVFVNTVNKAKHLVEALENKNIGIACSVLYGKGMDISLRDKTMEQFRKGQTVCLIASNVIARGIDIPAVGLVVNFEIPISMKHSKTKDKIGPTFDSETFMHRVGRTGRFGSKGVCINLLSKNDLSSNNMLDAIQKEYSLNIETLSNDYGQIKEAICNWMEISKSSK